ncbi:MAG: hypothetical protein WCX73_04400 [Candidatus Pacearchaeota archaeon]
MEDKFEKDIKRSNLYSSIALGLIGVSVFIGLYGNKIKSNQIRGYQKENIRLKRIIQEQNEVIDYWASILQGISEYKGPNNFEIKINKLEKITDPVDIQ